MARCQGDMWERHADASADEARAEGRGSSLLLDAERDDRSGSAPVLMSGHRAGTHTGVRAHIGL